MRNRGRLVLIFITSVLVIFWVTYIQPSLKVATGYAAKYMCSYTFLSNVSEKNIDNALQFFPMAYVDFDIDKENKTVKTSIFGIASQQANYYENGYNCGCVLGELDVEDITTDKQDLASKLKAQDTLAWPQGNLVNISDSSLFDHEKLSTDLDKIMKDNPNTLAIVVAHKEELIAEKYQKGVKADSRLLGWSMTKTVGSALYGTMNAQGVLNADDPSEIKEWENDERINISMGNLLQMSSGLDWLEDYDQLSSVTRMLYLEEDMPAYAVKSKATAKPNEKWYYSSGTSNILAKIMREKLPNYSSYANYPYEKLFHEIGMYSATIETDNKGNHVLSSYGWATARDWTRFGLLYLYEGNWFGKQVFTSDWVKYSTTDVEDSKGTYGAQIWLNKKGDAIKNVPTDAFYEDGFGGQRILIIPSKEMVITVMSGNQKGFDFEGLYEKIFAAYKG
ncbi:serine hydrolase domain-containing protein [Sediminitomix flava]|uniref:CubicO group peptidase (Beta-lactamase class C family) n=1 Tax=Sediminitomix flava TaxID=379075 RepID=A0A315ZIA4_SEDFL|nr:serine hydrolase [Sediminitomix flava]PWJ44830.1 CubicO group peptidase (beta-lactamase class C family) [Sediminitomix flava]